MIDNQCLRILVGGYYAKQSGKTTFCRHLFKTLVDQSLSVGYYKPISGLHCWHDMEFIKQTALKGYFISEDAVLVLEALQASPTEQFALAQEVNHTHVLFSRLDLSDELASDLLTRHVNVSELERELKASIDSIPLLARYGREILVNDWWWKHPSAVILGSELRKVIQREIPSSSVMMVEPASLSGLLFWDPHEFIHLVDTRKKEELVQIIELHDDDVLSGLANLHFDFFILVAGDFIHLTTQDEWSRVTNSVRKLALSYPASKLFPKVKWLVKGNMDVILEELTEQLPP